MNKKFKRFMAWLVIILLLACYAVTFILGVTGKGDTANLLMAAIAATVIIPVTMYAILLFGHVLQGGRDAALRDIEDTSDEEKE